MDGPGAKSTLGVSIREWLGTSLREQGRGLPKPVQTAGFLAYVGVIGALAWLGGTAVGQPVGGVVGGILGFVMGALLSTAIFRTYRQGHGPQIQETGRSNNSSI